MDEKYYLFTFNTSLGPTKQIRINDANSAATEQDIADAVYNITQANVFNREKYGSLTSAKTQYLVTVTRNTVLQV